MTDKIIIDGVDVSGCEYLNSKYFSPCGNCKNDPNCLYKQLKREQTLNKVNLQRSIDLNKELNNLQTELQAEKEKVKELEEKYKDYKQSGSELAKNLVFEAKRTEKYKQALEAIRMIAGSNLCDDDCDECPSNCECDWKDVTDKIDEVLKCKI